MTINDIELERLREWFNKKYDWEIYLEVEKELYKRMSKKYSKFKRLMFIFNGIPEKERIWLIEETRNRLEKLWNEKVGGNNGLEA